MLQTIYRLLIELTNGRWTSGLLKKFAQSKASKFVVPSFSKTYKLNVEEMDRPLSEYVTLHDLFTRRLREGVRPVDMDPSSVVSPVDAVIEDIGSISLEHTIHVKGKSYSILEMLGSKDVLKKYIEGTYMVLYLSPSHYHRIHSPISGKVTKRWTLGKKSYPVNKLGLKYGRDTLSKNYRTITEVQHSKGHVSIVKVGAMFVNSIEVFHEGEHMEKGKEIAYFTFGSTIVLLFEKDTFNPVNNLILPKQVKVGEKIGEIR